MKKAIALIIAALLVLCMLTSAIAEINSDPTLGISIDIPDDYMNHNVGITPQMFDAETPALLFQYMDYDQLMPAMDALKEASMSQEEGAYETAYYAYMEEAAKYSVTCALVIGVPTDKAEEKLTAMGCNIEDLELIGSNSTHTYYKAIDVSSDTASEEIRTAAEASLDYISSIIDSITIIEIEAASDDVSDEAVAALMQFSAVDMDGNPVDGSLFAQAELTVLNIWGTYCNPCIAEMPELGVWAKELPENVQLVGLIIDVTSTDDSNFAKAQKILSKSGAEFVNILYNDTLADLVSDIVGTPTTLFLDSNGNQVADAIVGANMDGYKAAVEAFLSK